jgi:hypothetical protein
LTTQPGDLTLDSSVIQTQGQDVHPFKISYKFMNTGQYRYGVATPGKGSVGAGTYCNISLKKRIAAGQYGSNFDGEIIAIWQALKYLNKQHLTKKNIVVLYL